MILKETHLSDEWKKELQSLLKVKDDKLQMKKR